MSRLQPALLLLTGAPRSGKTIAAAELARAAVAHGWAVGGFVAHGRWRDGRRDGFDLERLDDGARVALCRAAPGADAPVEVVLDDGGAPRVGRFCFDAGGLALGEAALRAAAAAAVTLAVVDEVGWLELAGGGWDDGVRGLLASHASAVLLVVRDELVGDVLTHYGREAAAVIAADDPRRVATMLAALEGG